MKVQYLDEPEHLSDIAPLEYFAEGGRAALVVIYPLPLDILRLVDDRPDIAGGEQRPDTFFEPLYRERKIEPRPGVINGIHDIIKFLVEPAELLAADVAYPADTVAGVHNVVAHAVFFFAKSAEIHFQPLPTALCELLLLI